MDDQLRDEFNGLMQYNNQLNETIQQNIDQLNETIQLNQQNIDQFNVTIQQNQQSIDQLRDEFNGTMQYTNQLNETMQFMQTNMNNYIASNDITLEAINDTLQYVVKTPMVIVVPSTDEINHHRSKIR